MKIKQENTYVAFSNIAVKNNKTRNEVRPFLV